MSSRPDDDGEGISVDGDGLVLPPTVGCTL